MEIQVYINEECEEKVIIYAHQKTRLVESIERLVSDMDVSLIGYKDREAIRLSLADIYCFSVEENKIYALTNSQKLLLKSRLYKIEEILSNDFVKINQSCIVNIKKIQKFDVHISGSLRVFLKNGYSDYVSRRNLKNVKERLGL